MSSVDAPYSIAWTIVKAMRQRRQVSSGGDLWVRTTLPPLQITTQVPEAH